MSDENERFSRSINTYSSMLSLLGVINGAGIAAVATILQISRFDPEYLQGAAISFLVSLVLCLIAMTCLIGQAKNKQPNINAKNLSYTSFASIFFMAIGIGFLLVGLFATNDIKVEKPAIPCLCDAQIPLPAPHHHSLQCTKDDK
jgi:hypothetical protein